MPLQVIKAKVTSNGIMVGERAFTCSLAIKEQWFFKALKTAPFDVDFYMNTMRMDEGFIMSETGYEICALVHIDSWEHDRLTVYFKKLSELRMQYRAKKKFSKQ